MLFSASFPFMRRKRSSQSKEQLRTTKPFPDSSHGYSSIQKWFPAGSFLISDMSNTHPTFKLGKKNWHNMYHYEATCPFGNFWDEYEDGI